MYTIYQKTDEGLSPLSDAQTIARVKQEFKTGITYAFIKVLNTEIILTQDDYIKDIELSELRFVPEEGIFGQCVAKKVEINLNNEDMGISLEDQDIEVYIGVKLAEEVDEEIVINEYYIKYGTYIIQHPENETTNDNTTFVGLDYMIRFNQTYNDEIQYPCTLRQLAENICSQLGIELAAENFRNEDFVVVDNQFVNGETFRNVLQGIALSAFSWARIDEENVLHFDLGIVNDVTEEIDYDNYYNLNTAELSYGPINRIIIRESEAEGENVTLEDAESIEQYGATELVIVDNPFAYTQEKREQLIQAGTELYGFTYMPVNDVSLIGYAYLNCKDKIRFKTMQDEYFVTYLFNHIITYNGATLDEVQTPALTKTETLYRYIPEVTQEIRNTQIIVDKQNQTIQSVVQLTNENGEKITRVEQDLEGYKLEVKDTTDDLQDEITEVKTTLEGIITDKTVIGGQNLIKNSVGYFGNEYWQIDEEHEGNVIGNTSTEVKQNGISGSALELKNETIYQNITEIKNGEYYLSLIYKKIISSATCTLKINETEISLNEEEWTSVGQLVDITGNNIRIEITSDMNSACLITDFMLVEGNIQVSWSQNANESYTDTVQIGKGIKIKSTGADTEFEAVSDGISIKNLNSSNVVAEFTKYGTETEELIVKKDAKISGSILIQKIGSQTWFSSL